MSTQLLINQLLADVESATAAAEQDRVEFERRQEETQKAIADKMTAVRVLEQLERKQNPRLLAPEKTAALNPPVHSTKAGQGSFIDTVAMATKGMASEITTAVVYEKLSAQGVPLGDDPRTKISTALARLEKKGELIKVVSGGIGRAHAYRVASQSRTEAEKG